MLIISKRNLTSEEPSFVNIPPNHPLLQNAHPIRIVQQGYNSNITPKDYFCHHVSMLTDFESKNDFTCFEKLKNYLFETGEIWIDEKEESKEQIIYSCVFNQYIRKPL